METRDERLELSHELVTERNGPATPPRRVLTAAHLEPWKSNVIDVTMADGTHRIGLLERIEGKDASLRPVGRPAEIWHGGTFRIGDAIRVERAPRN